MKKKNAFKYSIGQKVNITNPGNCYTTYRDMFQLMGLKNPNSVHNISKYNTPETIYTIINMEYHETDRLLELYALSDPNGNEIVISIKGIKPAVYGTKPKVEKIEIPKGWEHVLRLSK